MFHFNNTRKPNFKEIQAIDYEKYWAERGFAIHSSLKEREVIILGLIPAGKTVADIGCGNSRLPVALKQKGASVDVGDISREVLKGYASNGILGFFIDLEHIAK